MAREASEARNKITSAIAAGSTHLLKSPLGTAARFCGVSIVPGMIQFTLIFNTFNSLARDSVNRSTALFDALYAAYPALPDKPSRLATLIIAPRFWRSICGMTARQQSSVVRTLMLKRKSQ